MAKVKKEKFPDLNMAIVQYANRLSTRDIGLLSAKAQDLLMLLLSGWRSRNTTSLKLPAAEVKNVLGMSGQRDSIVDDQTKIIKKLVRRSYIEGESNGVFKAMALIPYVEYDLQTGILTAECRPELLAILREHESYTRFHLFVFTSIRKKYSKNLFRIFCRNYKGQFTMSIAEFRKEFGVSEKTTTSNLSRTIKDAINDLENLQLFTAIVFTPLYESARGNPLKAISFSYKVNQEKIREILGQEQLPGLADDGAALPTQQAAPGEAAAPAPMPPAAAEKPLLTGEDLIKPSAKQILQAIAADGLAKSSGNAGGGKRAAPEIPHCPNCSGEMGIRHGKNGWFLYCKKCPKTISGKPLHKMGLCFDQEGRLSWL